MNEQIMREPARVLFHLNGYTKVLLERTEGAGMADGGIVWEISTDRIPMHLRTIGSRFVVQYRRLTPEEMNDVEVIRRGNIEIMELDGD